MNRAIYLALLLLAGCATAPVPTDRAKAVPDSRIFLRTTQSPATALVIVKRDSGLLGAACGVNLYVDGVREAELNASEKIELYLPLGERILSVKAGGICGGGTSEMSILVEASKAKTVRISSSQNGEDGGWKLQQTAF